jgi:ApeA-like protein/HEPN superfamily Apea-like protein
MAETKTLRGDFELRGTYWLPDRPGTTVAGVLSCHGGQSQLDLLGAFYPFGAEADPDQVPLIVGITNEGPCTLRNAIRTNLSFQVGGRGGVTETTWTPTLVLVGAIFESPDEMVFERSEFEFDALEAWLGRPPFDEKYEEGSVTARYDFPPEVSVDLSELNATLSVGRGFSSRAGSFRTLRWESAASIGLSVRDPQPFDWFMERLGDTRALLGLLVGDAVTPIRMRLRLPGARATSVEAIFSATGRPAERSLHPAEMLVPYQEIEERFPDLVHLWFERQPVLQNVVALLFGTLYAADLPHEFRFLALTQALETLHRRIAGGFYVDESAYAPIENALVAAIPANVASDHRQALKSRMKYGNEFSQNRRLSDLFKFLEPDARAAIATDPAAFTREVVAQRNYLTHYPAGENPPMTPAEMFYASVRLRGLLTLLLLREIEIVGDQAVQGLNRSRWWYFG